MYNAERLYYIVLPAGRTLMALFPRLQNSRDVYGSHEAAFQIMLKLLQFDFKIPNTLNTLM